MAVLYVAGGCFWGLEALLREQAGVIDTEAGYCGGSNKHPSYEMHPGHAEAVRVTFNTDITSYKTLLDYFFRIHDPTTRNRQGNDIGESYRSTIFYMNKDEKAIAERVITAVNLSGLYDHSVVTTLEPLTAFWPAESYHQDYLQKNPNGYSCHFLRSTQPILKDKEA